MPRGSLYDVLHGANVPEEHRLVTLPAKLRVLKDVADGMRFLHDRRVIHRDLKSQNILLDDDGHAKICDFGISRLLPADKSHTTSIAGTSSYKALEVLMHGHVTQSSDLYSFGVVMWETLSGQIPWNGLTEAAISQALNKDAGLPISSVACQESLREILRLCLSNSPDNRPAFSVIFAGIHEVILEYRGFCPAEYICPITYEIMKDPVLCDDSITYERAAIERSLRIYDRSPITNEPVRDKSLRFNRALKSLIDQYKREEVQQDALNV